ncbi:MAG: hypothetical protein CMM95_02455 [Rickettsiales bacterium]|nr:hypothetical protein [Rickettsiales bacterium]
MHSVEKKIIKILEKKKIKFSNLSALQGDASERRYFKIQCNKTYMILMYDNNKKNLKKFLKVSKMLENKVTVPKIIRDFREEKVILLEDFGNTEYGKIIDEKNKKKYYKSAIDALIEIQKFILKLSPYSIKEFLRESDLFFEWYVSGFKNKLKIKINELLTNFIKKTQDLPQVFVHRDYHIDNLFFLNRRSDHFKCGWIDYQDALIGPCVYDLVSLTQDARVNVPKKVEEFAIEYYLRKNPNIDKELFIFSYSIIAIQRHMKVLGIFSRLAKRDGKKKYLSHIPRVKKMLISNLKKNEFSELNGLLINLIKNDGIE